MVRLLARVLGGANSGAWPWHRDELPVHRHHALKKPYTVHCQPEAFPLTHAGARRQRDERLQLAGSASRTASTCSVISGTTCLRSTFGNFVPSHGFDAIRRSRIAVFITVDTMPCTTPTVAGASARPFTHACISLGTIDERRRSPSVG